MQFASPRGYRQVALRARAGLPGGVVWTSLLVFLLTLSLAKSTVTAHWVDGIEIVPSVALAGAILMGLLALTPIPWGTGLGAGFVLGPVAAGLAAWPLVHAEHGTEAFGWSLVHTWWGRILDGSAVLDNGFDLFLISWLMWVTGGWLAWCVLRWRRPLLGLVPGAAAFSTTVLNLPTDQNGYVLAILVLTLALLLWSNYTSSIANAMRAHVKLTGDARWDFWESGLVAMAALIVLAIMLPPLSTVDRTANMESSAFNSWAQLLQTLSHPGQPGSGVGGAGTTGFSADVLLNSSLKRTTDPVFTYTITGDFSGRPYFRGVNETVVANEAWRYYSDNGSFKEPIPKESVPNYAEDYAKLAVASFSVRMLSAPSGYSDILFFPGRLYRVNRDSTAIESLAPAAASRPLINIDRLSSLNPPTSRGTYVVTVEYSTATDVDLQAAGTSYPDWVAPYMGLPANGYRSPALQERIHQLALSVVNEAGAKNPYDMATAIESWLRDPSHFSYTLNPQRDPNHGDPLAYFLFTSHQGYCEFFASAMGDMLRSLGIPTRLASGFGTGVYDTTINSYKVRSEDAHTWVEVYFPAYGWIEFEPTADNVYFPITRGATGANLCLRDLACDNPTGTTGPSGVVAPPTGRAGGPQEGPTNGGGGGGFALRIPDTSTLTKIIGVVLALVLLFGAAIARYLRPRTVMGVWRRTLVLARIAGADQREGETPLELGRRLAWSFPEAADPMRSLTNGFVIAAYAPPEVARSARASVMEAWSALRPLLLRRAFARFRAARV